MINDYRSTVGDGGAILSERRIESHGTCESRQRRPPKKIQKSEREKQKREHLNDLFLELGHTLDPSRSSHGKASILFDVTRLLREMLTQVESLRQENAALVSESQFVAIEKKEIKEENLVLKQEIWRLQDELRGGGEKAVTIPVEAPIQPVFIRPCNDDTVAQQTPVVTRPLPRYPSAADHWPAQILNGGDQAA
ncbi:basic helix-loop-helix (bHLH) DNA-binding superfamily protein [Wolffia australiana]